MSWPISKLGAVISFIRGVTFTPEDQVEPFSDGSTIVMRTKNVQVAGLDQGDLIAVPSGFVRRKEQSLREGDILVSSANSWELVGKASYVPKLAYEATAGGFISIVRAKETLVDSRYLYHWVACPSTQHKIRHCGRQTTNISNLDVGRFQDLDIPLPPLPEQKRIAAILDKADAIRRKRQQAIQLADDFLRAVFLDMFGDPVTNPKGWSSFSLDSLVKKTITYGILKPEEYVESGIPMLRIQDLKGGRIDEESSFHLVSERLSSEYARTILEGGEVLISLVGTIGLVAKVPNSLSGANVHRNLGVIALRENELSEYVCSLMQLPDFMVILDRVSKGGVHRLLNLADLKEVEIPIPDIALVREFTRIKESVRSMRELSKRFSRDLMFESLSHKAFSGQL